MAGRTSPRNRAPRDGGVSAMEWAILTPILLLLIGTAIQFTLYMEARQTALAAAQSAARVARTQQQGDWRSAAQAKAGEAIANLGPHLFDGTPYAVSSEDANGDRFVEVHATAVSIVPGMSLSFVQRSGGPVECFRPDTGNGLACG